MDAPGPRPSYWNVPYQRTPFFTGREETLSQLYRALQDENAVALSHPQGISGLGGIGKTQTALEYVYRYHMEYVAVFWVRADSTSALTSSFVELAHLLDLPERMEQNQNNIVEAVLNWLRFHTGWLLIVDNLEDISGAMPFLPAVGMGHILLTTRAHALGGIAQRLELQKMEPEVGALLLLRRASILPLQAPLGIATKEDRELACDISQELDGMPLALDQAGAYIKETSCTLKNYLSLYRVRRRDLLRARGSSEKYYPASVATTWSLAFEKVGRANSAATELLNFCAFLDADAIPEEMIVVGAQYLTPSLQVASAHPLAFDQAAEALLAFSLVRRNENETLSIHRLVQVVVRESMSELIQREWAERAVRSVNLTFPDEIDFQSWERCERYLPHALVCAALIDEYSFEFADAAHLLHQAGYYLDDRAKYVEVEPLYKRALAIREKVLGPEHPDTAGSLNNLANLYDYQKRYTESEPLRLRTLAICEKVLGPEHLYTSHSLNNLANLYNEQGKYLEAELLHKRALEIRQKLFGQDHPYIASSLNNLANLYNNLGRYAEAELFHKRVLEIRERTVGLEHPDTARSLWYLAVLYQTQGRNEEAEAFYKRALIVYEKILEEQHPNRMKCLGDYTEFLRKIHRDAEAEQLTTQIKAVQLKRRQKEL